MALYTDKELKEIERDPVRLRAYFWRIAWSWRLLSKDKDYAHLAPHLANAAEAILENLDSIVDSALVH